MGRKRSPLLTDAELALMDVLWRKGEATVAEVLEELPPPRPTYNSVQTRLNILEEKHYAKREQRGRAYAYRPCIERDRAAASALHHLVSRFFKRGSALALRIIADESFSEEELAQLEAAIAKKARRK